MGFVRNLYPASSNKSSEPVNNRFVDCHRYPACVFNEVVGLPRDNFASRRMEPNPTVNNFSETFRRDGTAETVIGNVRSSEDEAGTPGLH
jgi:hypothetical protein